MTMTLEQVTNLYHAVQWSIDQNKLPKEQNHHKQKVWGEGKVTDEVVTTNTNYQYKTLACDSNMCIAGNAVIQAGDKFVVPAWMGSGTTETVEHCVTEGGEVHTIRRRAMELMGLTDTQASVLFDGWSKPENIVRVAKRYAADAGYEIDFVL